MTQSSEELIGQFIFSLKLLFEKDTGCELERLRSRVRVSEHARVHR